MGILAPIHGLMTSLNMTMIDHETMMFPMFPKDYDVYWCIHVCTPINMSFQHTLYHPRFKIISNINLQQKDPETSLFGAPFFLFWPSMASMDFWIPGSQVVGKLPLGPPFFGGKIDTPTVDGRIIQTLIHRATPLTPNINVIFLFGSFLRMDEINQTPRAGTALRNHNIEIRGR